MDEKNPNKIYPSISIELLQNPSKFYAIPVIGILVKLIILIPVFFEIIALAIAGIFISIINSFVVLITGKYWKNAYNFNLGFFRLITKIAFFVSGLTNRYPGFSLSANEDFSLDIAYPEKPSRFFTIPIVGGVIRYILLIPFSIYSQVIQQAAGIGIYLIAWAIVLFKGKYPESIFELTRDGTRLLISQYAYTAGMSDKYPNFSISMNHKTKKLILIAISVILLLLNTISNILNPEKPTTTSNNFYQTPLEK